MIRPLITDKLCVSFFCLFLGKTTVARLYGSILKDFGLLTSGELLERPASDFIGSAVGQSEEKTKAILASADGKVLLIDEAYNLDPSSRGSSSGGGGLSGSTDPYREGVVNTLVERIQNVPGENRCVLMLGYRPQMESFLNNANIGLKRRFALENAFQFDDYTADELLIILRNKLAKRHVRAHKEACFAAIGILELQKKQANFGNGGSVENLISAAILTMERRLAKDPSSSSLNSELLAVDFNPSYGQEVTLDDLFTGLIGCDHLIAKLCSLQKTIEYQKKRGRADLHKTLPMNFIFAGPPGTGKCCMSVK